MSQACVRRLAGMVGVVVLGTLPAVPAAEGIPGGFVGIWRSLCPLVADDHGFVDAAAWRSMLHLPASGTPRSIDHWTSVEAVSSASDAFPWGSRLQVSHYEQGRTSLWIDDPRINLKDGYRSEVSISGTDPKGQLPMASVEKAMDRLGFRKIGGIEPYGRDGESVFVRNVDTSERLTVRFGKGPETIPYVSGITLVGYRRDHRWTIPPVQGACDP